MYRGTLEAPQLKRLSLTALLTLTLTTTALAQDQTPGSHFVANRDADGKGPGN